MKDPLWVPSKERIRDSLMYEFMQGCPEKFDSYFDLHEWSIRDMESFWSQFWLPFGSLWRPLASFWWPWGSSWGAFW